MQALFSASVLLLAEKIFLRYVAINFHRRALADRIAENQLGLRALDRLSNTTPIPPARRQAYGHHGNWKRGHRSVPSASRPASILLDSRQGSSSNSSPINEKGENVYSAKMAKPSAKVEGQKQKRKAVAAVIVDGLGDAIGQVALKNSKYNREGGTLYSAGKLARKLFSTLSNVYPPRSVLLVEGMPQSLFRLE